MFNTITPILDSVSMSSGRLKILLIAEQCNPDWVSVPLVAYRFFEGLSRLADVTLVTHDRNRPAFAQRTELAKIIYISESSLSHRYHELISKFVYGEKVIWPLYLALTYPIYAEFNNQVYQQFKSRIQSGEFDVVHALTPMVPRYPVKIIKACQNTPFVLGPVNGGVPFPPGFQDTAKKEYAGLNWLRSLGRALIPGYRQTYQCADRVISGSTYTRDWLQATFKLSDDQLSLIYENGVPDAMLLDRVPDKSADKSDNKVKLLFVGRLVPYKCADILLKAIAQLPSQIRATCECSIVGTGPEQAALTTQAQNLGITDCVRFVGWVDQAGIYEYYRAADIFCFPSIREFGGAVVMEAMACGLPCIVAHNGGIGEYVTDATGFRIKPDSRAYLTQELANKIQVLVENPVLRQQMAVAALEQARTFVWSAKATQVMEIYCSCICDQ